MIKMLRNRALLYWLLFTAVYAVLDMPIIMLAAYALYLVLFVARNYRHITVDKLIELALFSVIIPNNYVVILIVDLLAVVVCLWHRGKTAPLVHNQKALSILGVAILAYAIINGLAHGTPAMNFAFAALYFSGVFASFSLFRHFMPSETKMEHVMETLKVTIVLQVACVALYAVTHLGSVLRASDLDWVVGTFGYKQGNVFFVYCAFASFIFLNAYRLKKRREDVFYALISIVLIMSTGSIGLTGLYMLALVLMILINPQVKLRYKMYMLAAMVAGAGLLVALNPGWVIKDLLSLSDATYLMRRIGKINSFSLAFVEEPNQDLSFLLFGAGLAQGSSRAALTCTGLYISDFESLFHSVYKSEYFTRNIYPFLKTYLTGFYGLAHAPLSSVLSIQNELGYVGTILCASVGVCMFRRKKALALLTCLFGLLILMWDNYLEYSKIMFIFTLAYYYCGQWNAGRLREPEQVMTNN